jgi:outer membrane protein
MKKILLILVLISSGVNINAQIKVANCDFSKITDSLPATKKAVSEILKMKKDAEEEIQTMQEELQKKYIKYQQDEANMNKFTKENMEKDLNQMQQNAMARERELQERLQQAQITFIQPIEASVVRVVSEVAEKEKYDYVVEKSAVIFATPKYDITDKVLTILLQQGIEE